MITLLKKEWPLLLWMTVPLIYLYVIYDVLPNQVPIHWNVSGEIDDYGDKRILIFLPFLFPWLVYVLLTAVPHLESGQKLNAMGGKYHQLKSLLSIFLTVLSLLILYVAKTDSTLDTGMIQILIGILYLIFGNYFKTLKTNYFMGIRTPWTLKDEKVWKATHQLGGWLWFIGGLVLIASGLWLPQVLLIRLFIAVTVVIVLIPVCYSYYFFKKINSAA